MLIPGEALWQPRRVPRLPGVPPTNPIWPTTVILLKIVLWAATGWVIAQWVTIRP